MKVVIKIELFRYKLIKHNHGYKLYVFKGKTIATSVKSLEEKLSVFNIIRKQLGRKMVTIEEYKHIRDCMMSKEDIKERCRQTEISNRAKINVFEYVMNNDFNAFITITFDRKKVERENAKVVLKKLITFFKNYKSRYYSDFKFLIIPEWHKDKKAIHFHGFVKVDFSMMEYKGMDVKGNVPFYIWSSLFNSFGANRLTEIYNKLEFAVYYATKYVLKGHEKPLFKAYYCSQKLKKSEVLNNCHYASNFEEFIKEKTQPSYESDNITIYDFNRDAPIVDTIISVLELQKGD